METRSYAAVLVSIVGSSRSIVVPTRRIDVSGGMTYLTQRPLNYSMKSRNPPIERVFRPRRFSGDA